MPRPSRENGNLSFEEIMARYPSGAMDNAPNRSYGTNGLGIGGMSSQNVIDALREIR
jgi:hypothetical protein